MKRDRFGRMRKVSYDRQKRNCRHYDRVWNINNNIKAFLIEILKKEKRKLYKKMREIYKTKILRIEFLKIKNFENRFGINVKSLHKAVVVAPDQRSRCLL